MKFEEFRKHGHLFVDWMADYFEDLESYPVKSKVNPNDIINQLPNEAPIEGESMEDIFNDFKEIILPGITHWQSPGWHAYFPGNSSPESVLAEMLTATLGAQCMIWETSPAAAELEEQMMIWMQKALGIPSGWEGVIQDSASTATLAALLTARESFSKYQINNKGFNDGFKYRVYASSEAHSSIDKAVRISGIGHENLIKIPVSENLEMNPEALEKAILKDIKDGYTPLFIMAAIGTTGTSAIDPLKAITDISKKHSIWTHVDAAYAGTSLILPENQWMIEGIEQADSFVFNAHKWMFTNFDCSMYYVKDPEALVNCFTILPEYLKTNTRGQVKDYRDWGIPLGRRFRALKLWFVIRSYGLSGLQELVYKHIQLAKELGDRIEKDPEFELTAPLRLGVVCFRFNPGNKTEEELNVLNKELMDRVNESGKIAVSHTKVKGKFTIRMVIGQTYTEKKHVEKAWNIFKKLSLSYK